MKTVFGQMARPDWKSDGRFGDKEHVVASEQQPIDKRPQENTFTSHVWDIDLKRGRASAQTGNGER